MRNWRLWRWFFGPWLKELPPPEGGEPKELPPPESGQPKELPTPEGGEPKELPQPETILPEPMGPQAIDASPEFQPYSPAAESPGNAVAEPEHVLILPPAEDKIPPSIPTAAVPASIPPVPVQEESPDSAGALPLPAPQAVEEALPPPSVPAPIPRRPTYPDSWTRERARYFSSGRYAPAAAAESFLAPDLRFRLGIEKKRSFIDAPSIAPPAPATPVVKAPARLMDEFTTNWDPALPGIDPSGRLLSVDPLLLTLFFGDREDGPEVPAEATAEYLTSPGLLAHAITLRTRLLQHWMAGGAPLSTRQLYSFALEISQHPGTTLLLCHNVAKVFARGGNAIRWEIVNRATGEYSDGESAYRAAGSPLAFSGPSILPALFAAGELSGADAGYWYRFFACGTAVCFAAAGMTRMPVSPTTEAIENRARQIVEASHQLRDATIELTPAYRGWLWVNAWMFVETAAHIRNQQAARAEAVNSMAGACFGLSQAGSRTDPAWRWAVPRIGGADDGACGAAAEWLRPIHNP